MKKKYLPLLGVEQYLCHSMTVLLDHPLFTIEGQKNTINWPEICML